MEINGLEKQETMDTNSVKTGEEKPNRTNVPNGAKGNVSRETILSDTKFTNMYRLFRKSGMDRRESLFNAAYLVCHNKYDESEKKIKNKYKSVPEHPVSWSADKEKTHKHNIWSLGMKCLTALAATIHFFEKVKKSFGKFFGFFAKIPKGLDNSLRAIKIIAKFSVKAILPVTALALAIGVGSVIYNESVTDVAFGIYIDGVYKGNTDNVDSVLEAKHQYERSLSERYGTPLVLECDVKFVAQSYDKDTFYKPGDTSIYDEHVKNYTLKGFGLYIDNVLAAVSDSEIQLDRTVDEYIRTRRERYMYENSLRDDQTDEFVLSNHIVVIAAEYPEAFFLSENELRALFNLPPVDEETEVNPLALAGQSDLQYVKKEYVQNGVDNNFSYSLNLDYSKLERINETEGLNINNSIPSSVVTVDIALAKDEVVKETVPFAEEYVEDETLLEGTRRLVSEGRDGYKLVYYKATYQGKKLIKREVSGEEVILPPVNKVIRIGTREATEEEKALIPTGTYIYPYRGTISSYFGWRILRGRNNYHQGLDIYGPYGDTIVAADGGEVIEVGMNAGYGIYCLIRHNEEIVTRYAHCSKLYVKQGDLVGQGFEIGALGATGNVTGVHVHFEIIKNGKTVDPIPYMCEEELPYM